MSHTSSLGLPPGGAPVCGFGGFPSTGSLSSSVINVLGARLQGPRLRFGGGYGVRSHLRIRFEGGSRQIGFIDTFLAPVSR